MSTWSSWKLLTSRIAVCSGVIVVTMSENAVPMFPPTTAGRRASSNILPASVVVVVLPFVPVIAMIGPGENQDAVSSSLTTCHPAGERIAHGLCRGGYAGTQHQHVRIQGARCMPAEFARDLEARAVLLPPPDAHALH